MRESKAQRALEINKGAVSVAIMKAFLQPLETLSTGDSDFKGGEDALIVVIAALDRVASSPSTLEFELHSLANPDGSLLLLESAVYQVLSHFQEEEHAQELMVIECELDDLSGEHQLVVIAARALADAMRKYAEGGRLSIH